MYKYKPLREEPPQIRLVTIETAASATQAIRLRLRHVELNSHLKYNTLSYTWGSPGPDFPACWGDDTRELAYVDGQEFPVRLNLHAALVQLRDDYDGTDSFWIDAICVDQSNVHERIAQVALMGQIYSGTQGNVTWLGPSDDGTEAAFRIVERLSTTELPFPDIGQSRPATEENLEDAVKVLQHEFGVDEVYAEWKALASIFERHYWQRAWVVQEVSLAQFTIVRCGSHGVLKSVILDLNPIFSRLLTALENVHLGTQYKALIDRLEPVLDSTCSCLCLMAFRPNPISCYSRVRLLDAMSVLRPQQSSDPRDKLFAALGISKNVERIMPDYSRNPEDLFRDYAREHIRSSASVHILGYCQYAPKVGYSTWAPDWGWSTLSRAPVSSRGSLQSGNIGKTMDTALFSAGGKEPLVAQFRNDNRVLVLQGMLIDKIIFVSSDLETWPESLNLRGWFGNLFEWAATLKAKPDAFPLIGRADWQFDETQGFEQFQRPVYRVTRESVLIAYARTMDTDTRANKHTGQRQRVREKDGIHNSTETSGRTFAVSALGCFCMVPVEARPGDEISVVTGGEVPLLLRPQQDGFQLVGECYANGFMDGEGMRIAAADHRFRGVCIS